MYVRYVRCFGTVPQPLCAFWVSYRTVPVCSFVSHTLWLHRNSTTLYSKNNMSTMKMVLHQSKQQRTILRPMMNLKTVPSAMIFLTIPDQSVQERR